MEGMEDAVRAGVSAGTDVKIVDGVTAGVDILTQMLVT
jgi:hypothetical protein